MMTVNDDRDVHASALTSAFDIAYLTGYDVAAYAALQAAVERLSYLGIENSDYLDCVNFIKDALLRNRAKHLEDQIRTPNLK